MSWRTLVTDLLVRDSLKSCLAKRLTLKVLMVTSSKSPSIWLNISQYLFKYVFRVSLSHILKDSKEAKGWGTLLQVTNREPNAWVSSLKELMESALRLSNHLIATGPRLDGKTLHIKASSFEWTAILWLKWLTCSTVFVLPLYMVKAGWVNLRKSFTPHSYASKVTWRFGSTPYS